MVNRLVCLHVTPIGDLPLNAFNFTTYLTFIYYNCLQILCFHITFFFFFKVDLTWIVYIVSRKTISSLFQ